MDSPDSQTVPPPCHIFLLPYEIRERIYKYALSTPNTVTWPTKLKASSVPGVSLLQTCRTINDEASPIIYAHNAFSFPSPSDANMFSWTHYPWNRTTPLARKITHLDLVINDRDVRLWTGYLGSSLSERSLMHDYPALKTLRIKLRSSFFAMLVDLDVGDRFRRWTNDPRLRELCMSLENKTKAEVQIRCLARMRREEIELLVQTFKKDLFLDRNGKAKTWAVDIYGISVVMEIAELMLSTG
ncbi:hypothetical protein P152DRAFT_461487 [Eremomyces bilateralis CBS 781.70]|uniref:F-box domain-containing protein n=1 Tax=Eremomyces bilateralis CBS 781.70 TaxID=1392243 RepID=A0A6G1FV65_9PEZI|nr:uncharacterized protein P152DRAFT_461487 [Eremomyces bilateralis CBS 781.70]KAF1809539.1 hypothetical protein P152DRAFT_461487 [Eremomyces bilateralis CBS 781.70]